MRVARMGDENYCAANVEADDGLELASHSTSSFRS